MLRTGTLMPVVQVSRSLNKSPSTVWRWITRGVQIGNRRVRLSAQRVGGNYFVGPDDLKQFFDETNETASEDSVKSALQTVEEAGI